MFIVEKYDHAAGKWKTIFKGNRRAAAMQLVYDLTREHPDRGYRIVMTNTNTVPIFWPEIIYRAGEVKAGNIEAVRG